MLIRLLQGGTLLALTVAIHAAVLSAMLSRLNKRYGGNALLSFSTYSWVLVRIAAVTVLANGA